MSNHNDDDGAPKTSATARSVAIIRSFPPGDEKVDDDQLREDAIVMAQVTQAANRGLAQRLQMTEERDLHEEWGYPSHKAYGQGELRLKPQEYLDLKRSSRFLIEHEPEMARRPSQPAGMPPPDVVSMLAKAMEKGTIDARDYQKERDTLWSPKISDEEKRDRTKELCKPPPKIKPDTVMLEEVVRTIRRAEQRAALLPNVPNKLKQDAAHLAEAFEKLAAKLAVVDPEI